MRKVILVLIIVTCLMLAGCADSADNPTDEVTPTAALTATSAPVADDDPVGETPVVTPIVPDTTNSSISPELTSFDLVAQMKVGWNLGNTFDATDGAGTRLTADIAAVETSWLGGSTNATTQTLIQAVKAEGFDTIRIPVTWSKVADPDNEWKIRADWLERIKQVVDWALDEDLFVIVNMHHDNATLQLGVDNADSPDHPGRQFYVSIWSQVAEVFKDYDERLIFESLNEPRHEGGKDEWWGGTQEVRDNINSLNQAFVDVVRASGSSNTHRILMLPTHAAGVTPNGMRDFAVPEDPFNTVNKFVLSIHTYSPFNWAHDGKGEYNGPGEIIQNLDEVAKNAERLGIPVVLGEWGSSRTDMGNTPDQDLRDEQRPIHAADYVREGLSRGMPVIWWDNGGFTGKDHVWGLIPRQNPHEVAELNQLIIDAIMSAANED